MTSAVPTAAPSDPIARSRQLRSDGDLLGAIEVLRHANRRHRDGAVEQELLDLRREGGRQCLAGAARAEPVLVEPRPNGADGSVAEVPASELTARAVREGWSRSGCVLVRGLVPAPRVASLVAGIDSAFSAYDVSAGGGSDADPAWFSAFSMPDRTGSGLPEKVRRRFMRTDGGLVAADSPRMVFELLELVDDLGVGAVMTELLGDRPLLSANKCTLRRIEPTDVMGGWHQDGNFLGDVIGSFNLWLALSDCGRDAPGLDLVPRRVDGVIASDGEAQFDWSLSERAVRQAAGDLPIARPQFRAGDALIFDHRLVHRTAATAEMTRTRYAIEAWFFAPSAYPEGQLPLLY